MPVLAPADYPAIRAALDVTFVERGWPPDAVLALAPFVPAAEARLAALVPDAVASPDPAVAARVRQAAVLLAASLVAPAVPQLARESYGGYSYERIAQDWPARAQALRAEALRWLAPLRPAAPVAALRRAPGGARW